MSDAITSNLNLAELLERLRRQKRWYTHESGPAPFMWDDLCFDALDELEKRAVETPSHHVCCGGQLQCRACGWLEPPTPSKAPAEPKDCEHLRSELLAEKRKDGEPLFEMRKCLDCTKIFRVRSSLKTPAPLSPAEMSTVARMSAVAAQVQPDNCEHGIPRRFCTAVHEDQS